ncbi:maleylpyruvate isomerase family mycothiol-dependent enzyme [Nocardioides zeae]|uniref:Maleylpyruvate isomerase family mycothiol-dependent enzyme n=1 Tax=Nocardioides imazamoxiresistens TaxID=3231893 RepID=A0ABU3Q162_9ACTN|nr:maleylpyruvate isomerase family mycothiol-dependent enzyme [Nocardioides zeae]MDT9595186.1 maleylpyruvate isomerase family mycothiol-dependent enzyme [Nocardioides zeae]
MSAAEQHRADAARFGAVVAAVEDWDAPSPVPEWRARDVVDHLVTWLPGFLEGSGIVLVAEPTTDPAQRWAGHAAAVQAVLDDPDLAGRRFAQAHLGEVVVGEAIDRFYTSDVVFHTWDLAQAAGVPHGLDPERCARTLAGMEPMDAMLRGSGQFGPRVPVAPGTPPADALMAFLGRDPAWRTR